LKSEIEQYFLNKAFSGKIGFGSRPVLLIIDCINAFTNKESPLKGDWEREIYQIPIMEVIKSLENNKRK
jgi:maleamate amidohydrolase